MELKQQSKQENREIGQGPNTWVRIWSKEKYIVSQHWGQMEGVNLGSSSHRDTWVPLGCQMA